MNSTAIERVKFSVAAFAPVYSAKFPRPRCASIVVKLMIAIVGLAATDDSPLEEKRDGLQRREPRSSANFGRALKLCRGRTTALLQELKHVLRGHGGLALPIRNVRALLNRWIISRAMGSSGSTRLIHWVARKRRIALGRLTQVKY